MEQILIRGLPVGTRAALSALANSRLRSLEGEAREIIAEAIKHHPTTLNDLLSMDEGADIDFEPKRAGLSARTAEL